MTTPYSIRHHAWACTLCLLFLGTASFAATQPTLSLSPELATRLGGSSVPLRPGPNAQIDVREKRSVFVPSSSGPAVTFSLPGAAFQTRQGMIAMELFASKRIGHTATGAIPRMVLVDCPALRVELWSHRDCPQLRVTVASREKQSTRICRIAYLKPKQWYHFAVSWNATAGNVELLIDGWGQQRVHFEPWKFALPETAKVDAGGMLGNGANTAAISVANVTFSQWFHDEARLRRNLPDTTLKTTGSEIRRGYDRPLDLSPYQLTVLARHDFTDAIPIVAEKDLFENGKRVREPKPGQWVLEGPGKAYTKDGQLVMKNPETGSDHLVLWLPRPYPKDVLLEFDITLQRADDGLAIVFFAARPCNDPSASIFAPGLAWRNGNFRSYIKGDLNSYHVSYLAADQNGQGIFGPRRTANIRKNSGFWLVACGDDQIQGKNMGAGPHRVRILKVGNKVRVEANHRLSVAFDDDGKTWGPVWDDGYIGLRQMNHTGSARYRNLTVYAVNKK